MTRPQESWPMAIFGALIMVIDCGVVLMLLAIANEVLNGGGR